MKGLNRPDNSLVGVYIMQWLDKEYWSILNDSFARLRQLLSKEAAKKEILHWQKSLMLPDAHLAKCWESANYLLQGSLNNLLDT